MKDLNTLKKLIVHLNELLTSSQKKKLVGVFVLITISAIFETVGVSAILPFVQALTAPDVMPSTKTFSVLNYIFGVSSIREVTIILGLGIIAIYVIKNIILLISSYARVKFSTELTRDIGILIMDSYMNHPYEYFTNTNSSEILQGINGDAYNIDAIVSILMQLILESMVVCMIGAYLIAIDPVLALGMLMLAFLCALVIVFVLKRKMSSMGIINRQAAAKMNQIAVHISNGIKEIHVMQKRKEFLHKFEKSEYEFGKTRKQCLFAAVIPERIIETVCIGGFIAVVLIKYAVNADMSSFVASLAVFAMAAFRILPSISRMSGYFNQLIFLRPGFDIAYKNISDAQEYMRDKEGTLDIVDNTDSFDFVNAIKIDNIVWRYSGGEKNVLDGLSFQILKGQSIGIIGESGAGKSTLSDILLGLYIPQKGKVTVDGHIISDVPSSWSKLIGYVPQSVYLLDDTLRENICFGDDNCSDEDIWEALEKASLKKFVESLPDGLDTMVGERGIKFSGGQRQRVAIARALYHHPSVMILDEATSALDNETEIAVMEAIESLQGTITMVIIAHRLTTIRNCDRIIKIENGKAYDVNKEDLFG